MIGEGCTQAVGGPHAEVMALRDAQARGTPTTDATAYVTLEPCSHMGRTSPCCDTLIAAGIARVVSSSEDPNPRVQGQGFARLRAAGIAVEVGAGASEARELNLGFFRRMELGRPWVRLKIAASLDGVSALTNGESQWITSGEARADGHRWRASANALLTGIGTVLADDPRLDVRGVAVAKQPPLAVLDSRLRTPPEAALFRAERAVWLYAASPGEPNHTDADTHPDMHADAPPGHAEVIRVPASQGQHIDLHAVMHDLAQREINEVHVEAGAALNGALLQGGLVDEMLLYIAPKILGPGRAMLDLPALTRLPDGQPYVISDVARVGPDLRLVIRITHPAN